MEKTHFHIVERIIRFNCCRFSFASLQKLKSMSFYKLPNKLFVDFAICCVCEGGSGYRLKCFRSNGTVWIGKNYKTTEMPESAGEKVEGRVQVTLLLLRPSW